MDARLKIIIGDSQLEIEGSEALVEKIYSDFKELLRKDWPAKSELNRTHRGSDEHDGSLDKNVSRKSKGTKGSAKTSKSLQRLDINFRPSGKQSLKDFVKAYKTPTKDELYLLSASYLNSVLGIKDVTVDHIYTCLDELNQRVPTHLKQVMINTKNDKGWIDFADGKITVSTKGQNHLKFDIEKA